MAPVTQPGEWCDTRALVYSGTPPSGSYQIIRRALFDFSTLFEGWLFVKDFPELGQVFIHHPE
jgi:hypothetical protein